MGTLDWTQEDLYKGCLIASLAHAIMVARYPDLSYEQSWDSFNYSVQDAEGGRGTITFKNGLCFGAFRVDRLIRESLNDETIFGLLPIELQQIAQHETLQYMLLDNELGQVKPVVTTLFWSDHNGTMASSHTPLQFFEKGGQLIKRQVMDLSLALESWQAYYNMSKEHVLLLSRLFEGKLISPNYLITLDTEELKFLGNDEEGLRESRESFRELGILWPTP